MKNVLKIVAVMTALALCLAFAGCAAPAPKEEAPAEAGLAGSTWVISSVALPDGTELTGDAIAEQLGETTYTFGEGGKGVMTAAGNEAEMTYVEGDGVVTLTIGGVESEMTVDGDTLVYENEGGVCTLVRQ